LQSELVPNYSKEGSEYGQFPALFPLRSPVQILPLPCSMPRLTNLVRLLNSSPQPIYVLDEERRIVFVNTACSAWTGIEAEELLGQQCNYHSIADLEGPAAVAATLCPPPQAFEGTTPSGRVSCRVASGELQTRSARFVSLRGEDGDWAGLLVIVAMDDLHELPVAADPSAVELHQRILRYRVELAARHTIDSLLGDSPAIRRVRAQATLAAESRAAVLISGPAGSGREDLGRAIHYQSGAGGRLIPLSCAVLSAELLASTIQAAIASEPFEAARARSTLLLTDVDQLPLEAQGELERAISTGSLRLIATAQQPLKTLVEQGRLREGLACLLGTIAIELPPLAERRADLPILAQAFLEAENARGGKQLAGFTDESLDELAGYGWPGDIAELIDVVREAHAHAQGRLITASELPRRITLAGDAAAHPKRVVAPIDLEQTLARIESELIERALAQAGGNKSRAAELLSISRARLLRRLAQLGLREESRGSGDEGGGLDDERI